MRNWSLVCLLFVLGGCAAATRPTAPVAPRGVPGFDTREYPGDRAMSVWRRESPYRWVGYYLESPCRKNSTWMGRRQALNLAGWGLAVLYVGQQQWSDTTTSTVPDDGTVRCTRLNLTAARGEADAIDAELRAASEGFPDGTVIFLNVERVDQVGQPLADYVKAWVGTLGQRGRFQPGIYVHDFNSEQLFSRALIELSRRGTMTGPPLWVARSAGFSLEKAPHESGFAAARIWQGILDTRETWGGVTLHIDVNVADLASPSTPRR